MQRYEAYHDVQVRETGRPRRRRANPAPAPPPTMSSCPWSDRPGRCRSGRYCHPPWSGWGAPAQKRWRGHVPKRCLNGQGPECSRLWWDGPPGLHGRARRSRGAPQPSRHAHAVGAVELRGVAEGALGKGPSGRGLRRRRRWRRRLLTSSEHCEQAGCEQQRYGTQHG